VIPITPLLSFTESLTSSCSNSSTGSIRVFPIGGTAPYSVSLDGGTAVTGIMAGGSTTFNNVSAGSHNVSITDAASTPCTYTRSVSVGSVSCCTAPTIGTQPSPDIKCAGQNASFTATATGSPDPSVQWQVKIGSGNFTNLSNGGVYSGATSTTLTITGATTSLNGNKYRAVFTSGTCAPTSSNEALLTVNGIPAAPDDTYLFPACDENTFRVRINTPLNGAVYTIKDKDGASINGVKVGTTTLTNDQYTTTSTANFEFSNIPAGSGYQVSVSQNSCPSAASSSCPVTGGNNHSPDAGIQENPVTIQRINIPASKIGVKAFPNPFNDKIRFVINVPESGKGSLEIFNTLGQKVKTVHQGLMAEGTQTFDFSVPMAQRSTLVYVLRLNGKQVTGKLLNSSK